MALTTVEKAKQTVRQGMEYPNHELTVIYKHQFVYLSQTDEQSQNILVFLRFLRRYLAQQIHENRDLNSLSTALIIVASLGMGITCVIMQQISRVCRRLGFL